MSQKSGAPITKAATANGVIQPPCELVQLSLAMTVLSCFDECENTREHARNRGNAFLLRRTKGYCADIMHIVYATGCPMEHTLPLNATGPGKQNVTFVY